MGGGVDKGKEWQMELLMEKLRSKASQYKSFAETAKTVRMTLLVGYKNMFVSTVFMRFLPGKTISFG